MKCKNGYRSNRPVTTLILFLHALKCAALLELVKSKEKAEKLEKDLNSKSTVSAFSMAGIMDRGKSKQDTAALVAENKNLTRLLAQNTKEHQEQV